MYFADDVFYFLLRLVLTQFGFSLYFRRIDLKRNNSV